MTPERLKELRRECKNWDISPTWLTEALDEIERLQKDRDFFKEQQQRLISTCGRLRAALEKIASGEHELDERRIAREALNPEEK